MKKVILFIGAMVIAVYMMAQVKTIVHIDKVKSNKGNITSIFIKHRQTVVKAPGRKESFPLYRPTCEQNGSSLSLGSFFQQPYHNKTNKRGLSKIAAYSNSKAHYSRHYLQFLMPEKF